MEPDENHHHACKRSRGADPGQPAKIGHKEQQHQEEEGDDEGEDGEEKAGVNGGGGGGSGNNGANSALWQNHISSRIYRVSRASGGKDRHSKVYTAKGLRDRRVRLSVSTAIQFYDLQDRLGYDQPSKAIEWLIKAAAAAIDELPALDGFPNPPPPPSGEDKLMDASTEGAPRYNQQQRHLATKSGCSSTSETSKGSVLSLSRTTECRVKAREPARERAAEESDEAKCHVIASDHHQKSLNPGINSRSSSFTELLMRGGGGGNNGAVVAAVSAGEMELAPNSVQKKTSTANYFGQACLFTQPQKAPHLRSGYSLPSNHSVHSSALGMMPFNIAAAGAAAAGQGDHQEMHPFSSFLQDHLIPVSAVAATEDYNLNFSVSPVLAGFNRGTLQSNSPSQLPHHHQHHHHQSYDHLHRLSTPVDGPMLPFFLGSAAAVSTAIATASGENQFSFGFDGRLQLCYGDGSGFGLLDLKRKEKS